MAEGTSLFRPTVWSRPWHLCRRAAACAGSHTIQPISLRCTVVLHPRRFADQYNIRPIGRAGRDRWRRSLRTRMPVLPRDLGRTAGQTSDQRGSTPTTGNLRRQVQRQLARQCRIARAATNSGSPSCAGGGLPRPASCKGWPCRPVIRAKRIEAAAARSGHSAKPIHKQRRSPGHEHHRRARCAGAAQRGAIEPGRGDRRQPGR